MLDESDPLVMPYDVFEDTVVRNPYIVQEPSDKQIDFLRLEHRNALYTGSAGSGKSSTLLMAALQFCHNPVFAGYSGLIVRRSLQDLKMPGGLIDRALEWLSPHLKKRGKGGRVEWSAQDFRLRFPNGSTIQFGYCDNEGDEKRYHGAEFSFVGLDEAVLMSDRQIVFFMSERLRRTADIAVPVRFRMATTPGGPAHQFIKERFIDPGAPGNVYLHATFDDNPGIDAAGYRESLEQIRTFDPVRYKQMLVGDWDAVRGGQFKQEWFGRYETDRALTDTVVLRDAAGTEVERFIPAHCGRIQTCDPAASTSAKADFFVNSTFILTPKSNLVWAACFRGKFEIQEQVSHCQRLYRQWRPQFLAVEEVMNQRALAQHLRRSTNPPMVVKSVSPMGRDKLGRAAGAIALAASGRIFLPQNDPSFPLADVLAELVQFTGESKKGQHDDIVDTLSYCTDLLTFVRPGHNAGRPTAPFRYEPRPHAAPR